MGFFSKLTDFAKDAAKSQVGWLTADADKATEGAAGLLTSLTGAQEVAPPAIQAPVTMPTSDDEAVRRARRRRIAMLQSASGRQSTIFNDPGEARLGG